MVHWSCNDWNSFDFQFEFFFAICYWKSSFSVFLTNLNYSYLNILSENSSSQVSLFSGGILVDELLYPKHLHPPPASANKLYNHWVKGRHCVPGEGNLNVSVIGWIQSSTRPGQTQLLHLNWLGQMGPGQWPQKDRWSQFSEWIEQSLRQDLAGENSQSNSVNVIQLYPLFKQTWSSGRILYRLTDE